ncbi:ADP-ribosylglycohydrolase family protein [Calidithermus roseus]|uniref:ADP-ribosylglycohydrolase n=1 Tax=Calidithermus roseus TaxID=1644118 RepID=A0A399EKV9_9DEIN|nr:ADP-ribosylglycohydrolase family protein [Calidithermus roseus]RIH84276.1 ADP-ribosylglycohydrolase [Calidithermus roseus]
MALPRDYAQRVYAGVLGKMIGVFMGRPIEGWTYRQIQDRFGEVRGYVNEAVGRPLIVPDDDLSGTFAFLRALEDNGYPRDLRSEQIGEAWLNYIVEGRSTLWWGGMGNSTEQTAYYRLKRGVRAPRSGSMELNTRLIAEQIGAQIFIDGWAMVAPGDPDLAFHLATEAARVSHDGEAVHAAQVLAVMESLAFVEPRLERLQEAALGYIPRQSVIRRLITDLRELRQHEGDWREAREWLEAHYGYDRYGGNVHVMPNHGVIHLSLLYGQDDFLETLLIANTAGWDTDCNAGNVGCFMGIKNGLAAIDAHPHLRDPLADRLFVSSAEGARSVTDAVTLTDEIVRAGHRLAVKGRQAPGDAGAQGLEWEPPKGGAQYHFAYPGSLQGFFSEGAACSLANPRGGGLEVRFALEGGSPCQLYTRSFLPPEVPEPPDAPYARNLGSGWNYMLLASPRFYPGQVLTARFSGEALPGTTVALACRYYNPDDRLAIASSAPVPLRSEPQELTWILPDRGGPIADLGLQIAGPAGPGRLLLDALSVRGEASVRFIKPQNPDGAATGNMWRRAWVNAVHRLDKRFPEPFRLLHMEGLGLISIGSRDWRNYRMRARLRPYLARQAGVAVRYQGLNRFYAVVLCKPGRLQIVKHRGRSQLLAETPAEWLEGEEVELQVEVEGSRVRARLGEVALEAHDPEAPLEAGGVALLIEEGWLSCEEVVVGPLEGRARSHLSRLAERAVWDSAGR